MPVAFEESAAVDVGETAEALHLEQFEATLQLREVLLDPGVGKVRQRLGPQALDRGSQFAQDPHLLFTTAGPSPRPSLESNICSDPTLFAVRAMCGRSRFDRTFSTNPAIGSRRASGPEIVPGFRSGARGYIAVVTESNLPAHGTPARRSSSRDSPARDAPDAGSPVSDRPIRDAPPSARRAIVVRLVFLLITLISLYVLWPSLLKVLAAWPELLTLNPGWFAVMFAAELVSYVCIWALQRIALRTDRWFGVITAHLSGNAFSRIVPGGAAAGGAIQYRLLVQSGVPATTAGAGLTSAGLISTATLFALPILAVPAMLAGRPVPSGLAQAAVLGVVVFVLAVGTGAILVTTDGLLRLAGRAIQAVENRVRRRKQEGQITDLPDRLVRERDEVRRTLGTSWWKALFAALGNWLFDYLALLAALAAVGSRPRPTLVLLAYVASMVLAMIPLTPGGLGFVEAGLTATLTLAGVSAPDAVLATLAYRLVSYWLPLPAGVIAAALHRRRYAAA